MGQRRKGLKAEQRFWTQGVDVKWAKQQQMLGKSLIMLRQAAQHRWEKQGVAPHGKADQQACIHALTACATPVKTTNQGWRELCNGTKRQ